MVGTKALENKNSRMYLVDKKSNGYVDKRVDLYPDYKEIEKARMIDVDVIDSPKNQGFLRRNCRYYVLV